MNLDLLSPRDRRRLGQLVLTDEVVRWLCCRGWPESDLLIARSFGAVYVAWCDALLFPIGDGLGYLVRFFGSSRIRSVIAYSSKVKS